MLRGFHQKVTALCLLDPAHGKSCEHTGLPISGGMSRMAHGVSGRQYRDRRDGRN